MQLTYKTTLTVVNNQTECDGKTDMCCSPLGYQCGLKYPPVQGSWDATGEISSAYKASFGAFPSQAMIFFNSTQKFLASAVLIDQFHVITTADRVLNLT
jgi:hypothetical protein